MAGLTQFSQASVIERVGIFVRLEAIRTEKHQTQHKPLQPYIDQEAIVKHARPWQQVLMFFARTQKEHGWKSPQYQFTRRQQEAWEALIREAEAAAARGAEEEIDEIDEEAEADEEQGSAKGNQAVRLPSIQKACLKFCIALLDQRITRREYDSPLVCALAVLSQGPDCTLIRVEYFVRDRGYAYRAYIWESEVGWNAFEGTVPVPPQGRIAPDLDA
jgi:hypothetical protein